MRLPLARSEGLVTEELGDELLVYDLEADRAHCLSATAGRVWQRCDGATQASDLARELGLDAAEITRAVGELDDCDLLFSPVIADGPLTITRRDLSFKVAKVGAVAATVPLILSIAAPAAAQTQSQIRDCLALLPPNSNGCGNCNDGGTAGGICCCCQPGGSNTKVCAAGEAHCMSLGGNMCTENDPTPK